MNLILDGVELPDVAALDLTQGYEPLGGSTVLRTVNGTAVKLTAWQKLRTSISGSGWTPSGLGAIDFSVPMVISCVAPRAIFSAGNSVALPAARRTDPGAEPYCFAILPGGTPVSTSVSVVADVATAAPVSGASKYVFHYYPELTVYADPPTEQFSPATGQATWTITAEEV